ncbi:MAG: hypothetical protein M1834_000520 [Cirrosporium novae-zelandiae]|nr:MAG: hypothetical protein M1834_000520 [Cirrosporium novae-zelandiae]
MKETVKMDKLFTPIKIGKSQLQQRIVMAPMARFRADDSQTPLPFVKEYYTQRASTPGTLLISEATFISPPTVGYLNMPAIYTPSQISAWKEITSAVHAQHSFIYMQIVALGRAADISTLTAKGHDLVSSSAVPIGTFTPTPRALTEPEIKEYIHSFAEAAKNAIEAGFDGVEIHGANGYLVDQFIQDTCNRREDSWGGSIENRSRFAIEVAKAVVAAVGADRTGFRLSPFSQFQSMRMADPIPQFSHLIRNLRSLNLAYLHLIEPRVLGEFDIDAKSHDSLNFALEIWGPDSPVIVAGGFKPGECRVDIENRYGGYQVAVAFGRYFTSNPDLVFRIREGVEPRPYERETFYLPKMRRGYVDFSVCGEFDQRVRV